MCPILYLLGLALADSALEHISSIEEVSRLKVPQGQLYLRFSWKEEWKTKSLFRDVKGESWRYFQAANQLRKLGERAGLQQNLTAYAIRRDAANAIHGISFSISIL